MPKIVEIDTEDTQLTELGLTYDLVMAGEHAELEADVKPKRKGEYVALELVNHVIAAYADDLLEAYRVNESLVESFHTIKEDLRDASETLQGTQAQLNAILEADENLAATETLLSTLEGQIDKFADSKVLDEETIRNLRGQIEELNNSQLTVEALAQEVDLVLDNIQQYFADEGIDVSE